MPKQNDFDSILAKIKKDIEEVLMNEVAQCAVEEMKEQIDKVVYQDYEPSSYRRKEEEGGLKDDKFMKPEIMRDADGNSIMKLRNTRSNSEKERRTYGHGEDRDIALVVEQGSNEDYYVWTKSNRKLFLQRNDKLAWKPRPFHAATKESLEQSGNHLDAMRQGLKRKNYDFDVR